MTCRYVLCHFWSCQYYKIKEAPTLGSASILNSYISFWVAWECDSTICTSVCSHMYLASSFTATGKYNPSVISEKKAVLRNQNKISLPLAWYTILTVLSCLIICSPLFRIKVVTLAQLYPRFTSLLPRSAPQREQSKMPLAGERRAVERLWHLLSVKSISVSLI